MSYTRTDLESIGEAFTSRALLEWSRRLLATAHEDLDRLRARGVHADHLQGIESARLDVERLLKLRKEERLPEPSLAKARRGALEEAVDWRIELRGLAQAVFDSRPDLLERFRPGIKVSRSLPQIASELRKLLEAAKECGDALQAVGMTEEFCARGREILGRLEEAQRQLGEERALTPPTTLELNGAKGTLYTRARFVCRLARVEFRHEPSKAAAYGYAPLRRRSSVLLRR